LLLETGMMVRRWGVGVVVAACLVVVSAGCTGGQETEAQELDTSQAPPAPEQSASVDAAQKLREISPAIPLYTGAAYRPDLTRRDSVMVRQQFGPQSEVITLGSDDSFPQVWHYYVTYLAQFRGYQPPDPYPPENKDWRTLEVHLNEAMKDPFVPGDMFVQDRQVILQISETEADPETVIRYIVTNQVPTQPVTLQ
jgi:hypothetical protein